MITERANGGRLATAREWDKESPQAGLGWSPTEKAIGTDRGGEGENSLRGAEGQRWE